MLYPPRFGFDLCENSGTRTSTAKLQLRFRGSCENLDRAIILQYGMLGTYWKPNSLLEELIFNSFPSSELRHKWHRESRLAT